MREVASTCSIATCVLPSLIESPDNWLFCKPSDLAARLLQCPFHLQISDEFIICLPFRIQSKFNRPAPSSTAQWLHGFTATSSPGSMFSTSKPHLHCANATLGLTTPVREACEKGLNLQVRNKRRRAVFFILSKADCVPPSRCGCGRRPIQQQAGGAGYESGARLQGANGCFGSGSLHFDLQGKNALESRGRGGGLLGIFLGIMSSCYCCVCWFFMRGKSGPGSVQSTVSWCLPGSLTATSCSADAGGQTADRSANPCGTKFKLWALESHFVRVSRVSTALRARAASAGAISSKTNLTLNTSRLAARSSTLQFGRCFHFGARVSLCVL